MPADVFRPLLDTLQLAIAAVIAEEKRPFVVGIDDVGIARIDGYVATLPTGDTFPIGAVNDTVIRARPNSHGRVVLLRAVDAVEKIVVGGDVIELRRRLVVLRGPVLATVHADGRDAVVAVDQAILVGGVDPQSMVIAVRRAQALEGLAAIDRAVQPGVGNIYSASVLRIGPHVREIPSALPEAMVGIDQGPMSATVVASIQPALFGLNQRINDIRVAT